LNVSLPNLILYIFLATILNMFQYQIYKRIEINFLCAYIYFCIKSLDQISFGPHRSNRVPSFMKPKFNFRFLQIIVPWIFTPWSIKHPPEKNLVTLKFII